MTHGGQQSIAVSADANQFENRRGVVVEAVGASELMEQEQHDRQKEATAIAGVIQYVLEDRPYIVSLTRLAMASSSQTLHIRSGLGAHRLLHDIPLAHRGLVPRSPGILSVYKGVPRATCEASLGS